MNLKNLNGLSDLNWITKSMLEKNITMDDVHYALKTVYEDQISCVYSDYNADKLIFRIRMNEVLKKSRK